MDLSDTMLGLLRIPHMDNTLCIDLLREEQPCAWFYSDDRIAALDDEHYWIQTGGAHRLYDFRARSTAEHSARYPDVLDSMRMRRYSMVQAGQLLVESKLVREPVPITPSR